MEKTDLPYTLADHLDFVRRRWLYFITIVPAAVFIAVYLAYTVTPMYRSGGAILLEASSIPEDMVRTTVATFADQHIELVQRTVMATSNLVSLVETDDPYPHLKDYSDLDKAGLVRQNTTIERVDPITFEPMASSTAFSIYYLHENQDIALAVAQRLVQMFLAQNREARTARATETYEFLLEQSKQVRKHVSELENRMANFRAKYGNSLPESQARNEEILDRSRNELEITERQILAVQERASMLELQLGQLSSRLAGTGFDAKAELASLRSELALALQHFTEDHPDVRRLRRSIDALSKSAGADSPDIEPDNPAYISVSNELKAAQRELSSLYAEKGRYKNNIEEYQRQLVIAQDVEPEYRGLIRSYEVAQQRYRETETNLNEADLARTLESKQQGARFSLIKQPSRPSSPYSPNRTAIILLGIVLGGALAVGIAAFIESSDPAIRNTRDLWEITEFKAIGAIPVMLNRADRKRRVITWIVTGVVFAAVVSFLGFTIIEAI